MYAHEKIEAAYKSAANYPDLAKKLIEAGVLSYTVEVSTKAILYRFEDGITFLHEGKTKPVSVAEAFNKELTVKTIRESQQGKITYPEFMQGIADAGVRFYEATLNGNNKRVTYIGFGGAYEELIPF
ncbi:hypothetical protein C3K47_11425 [Solitalea longa]|uniref:DUF1398 domain-containing protein n=1 Tax=Solitalea longa TaxID=2079460 RepID=A0A2S5A183_9SPHI|nr:DUF1398 family protein [Solitalea longa]POY36350.1 hypothetical protein C3K47_11425 [Solitalea longa]